MTPPSMKTLLKEATDLLADVTPGEWSAEIPGRNDAHMCRITTDHAPGQPPVSGARPVIAKTWDFEHIVSYVGLTRTECVANARLMAASKRLVRDLAATLTQQQARIAELEQLESSLAEVCRNCGCQEVDRPNRRGE